MRQADLCIAVLPGECSLMPHGANPSNSSATVPGGSRAGQAGADAAFALAAITRCGKTATIGAAAITCLRGTASSVSGPGRAGNTLAAGCLPAVSAPDVTG